MHKYLKAWHFVGKTLRDGRAVPKDGVKLVYDGPVVPCKSGLHASRHPFDALRYAPGPVLCLVECGGIIVPHGNPEDKIACSERTIIARMDATPMLRYFARQQALSMLYLYPGDPDPRVLDWLMGDDAAWSAAESAARSAAESAAWSAAWSAAELAAESAAESAAWSAARSAARSAFAA